MPVEFSTAELAKRITVEVKIKGFHGWIVRLWIAKCLIMLAVWISGMNIEIEETCQSAK